MLLNNRKMLTISISVALIAIIIACVIDIGIELSLNRYSGAFLSTSIEHWSGYSGRYPDVCPDNVR